MIKIGPVNISFIGLGVAFVTRFLDGVALALGVVATLKVLSVL